MKNFEALYHSPPQTYNAEGKERRVGVEIELSAPTLEDLAHAVEKIFPGNCVRLSEFEWKIENTDFGDFIVEVDSSFLKKTAREEAASDDLIQHITTQALGAITKGWVPYEIVTPPLPLSVLPQCDGLIMRMRELGAKGTQDSIWNAYGLHLNPELPALDARTITHHLKAYMCLHDWLSARGKVDFSRRVTPYINPFEDEYVRLVVDPNYHPDQSTLIDDYLLHNPTRNRSLDMLPLFAYLDEDRVRHANNDPLIKARPTFHYRLPNCDIDLPDWGIFAPWNDWCEVERLADQPDRLMEVCAAYSAHLDSFTPDILSPWKEKVKAWINDPS